MDNLGRLYDNAEFRSKKDLGKIEQEEKFKSKEDLGRIYDKPDNGTTKKIPPQSD